MDTYCSECGKPCEYVWEDVGIGAYEFWGMKGTDRRLCPFSRCCDAEVMDRNGNLLDESDFED